MTRSIHRLVLQRLVVVWLLLSTVFGGVVYWLGVRHIDDKVVDLILRESRIFTPQDMKFLLNPGPGINEALMRKVELLVDRHFSLIEIYDPQENHVATAHRPGSVRLEQELERRHHSFPLDAALHYERFVIDDENYLQILLPLRTETGELAGYLEGVYHIDAETLSGIRDQVYQTLMLVMLVILVTSVVLYPVILLLNRELLRFSRETLRDNVKLMEVLGSAVAVRDSDTHAHNHRVTLYAIHLAEARKLPAEVIRNLIAGAFLHDVGKIGISDAILRKPNGLTAEEFSIMRGHVRLGLDIVSKAYWLKGALDVIEFHHEKYDGTGYLQGLKAMEIPLNARIFAIVDVFDALTSKRPYKEPFSLERSLAMLRERKGKDFDPVLLEAFEELAPRLYDKFARADDAHLEAVLMERVERYFIEARLGKL